MTKFWTITIRGREYRALRRRHESFEVASQRAVKRAFGRGACVAYWREDGRQECDGRVVQMNLVGTVIGRNCGHGAPILAEARAYLKSETVLA